MADEPAIQAESTTAANDSKWVKGVLPDQPMCEVACQILAARLGAVGRALPLAAERSDDGTEHVHQLRISVRRAVESLKVFGGLIDGECLSELRERLRQIRLAADDARNWDVMADRFSHEARDGISLKIREQIKTRRREAQEPIAMAYRQVKDAGWEAKMEEVLQQVASDCHGKGKRTFGRQACKHLAPVVKKFFKAARSDLESDEALHELRIQGKKLRYTMEIVAVAFGSAFRKKLYPQITRFQDILGMVNDHATAKRLFRDWLPNTEDTEQRAFVEGLLIAEERATADLRATFLATWTPKVVSRLNKQFRAYC